MDGTINPSPNLLLAGAAYSNNFAQLASANGSTTLCDIGGLADSNLYIQTPPNNGTLSLVGATCTNSAGLGFDIFTAADGTTNTAYLVTERSGVIAGSELYAVNSQLALLHLSARVLSAQA